LPCDLDASAEGYFDCKRCQIIFRWGEDGKQLIAAGLEDKLSIGLIAARGPFLERRNGRRPTFPTLAALFDRMHCLLYGHDPNRVAEFSLAGCKRCGKVWYIVSENRTGRNDREH